ncbi:MAG: hypothetical protein AB3N11_11360 [Arenibacterium sp.]
MAGVNFVEIIDRRKLPVLKHHRLVLYVDDMDFRVAAFIETAIATRAADGVSGI